jgi:hypothetical protein
MWTIEFEVRRHEADVVHEFFYQNAPSARRCNRYASDPCKKRTTISEYKTSERRLAEPKTVAQKNTFSGELAARPSGTVILYDRLPYLQYNPK